jgi:uncharacterized protein YjbI with pentapeptide repeats
MTDEQIIYLSPEEELTNVRERLERAQAKRIILVIPLQTQLRGHVAWRLLSSRTRELGKDVLVISSDRQIRSVAKAAGFRVADSQESLPSTTKQRRSRQAHEQNGKQPPASQRPANDDEKAWNAYWKTQGQSWRTQPEIDTERQKYLAGRCSSKPDWVQGIYPFKDIKLSRADVEWLLATHEKGRGPVDWNDESQRSREGLDVRGADLSQEDLRGLPLACMQGGLTGIELLNATEEQRNMAAARMKEADLREAQLQKAILTRAQLQGADLHGVQLQKAILHEAQLQGATLREAQLDSVNLKEATLSDEKYGSALLADIRWGDINLTVVDWTPVKILGDERWAYQMTRATDYQAAVRANRQLAAVLRGQGLNEDADRFAYRAQILQRKVFWKQKKIGQYLFSLSLALLAGYGYKPWRAFLAYLLVITAFATAYFVLGQTVGPALSPLGSFVFSMTSFHGRGFFPGGIALDDPLTVLAALEAFVGLLIEVTFIATLTQRLFSK